MPHPLSLFKKLTVFCFSLLSLQFAMAQSFNSSTSAATGLTGRASVEAGDAVYLNPSMLAHLRGRHFYSAYSEHELAFTLSDNSQDATIPAGLGYIQRKFSGSQDQFNDISLSLAEFAGAKFAMGLAGHYYSLKTAQESYTHINADLGFMYTPTQDIGLALVAYNFLGESSGVPQNLRPQQSIGAGFNYVYKGFARFRVDLSTLDQIGAGLESYINKFLVTRLGYFNDRDIKRELLSIGAGFKGPRFSLNYAYQLNTQISDDDRHSVDLLIPF